MGFLMEWMPDVICYNALDNMYTQTRKHII